MKLLACPFCEPMPQDITAAKSQAEIIERIVMRLKTQALDTKNSGFVDFADHLLTEVNYLKQYLTME